MGKVLFVDDEELILNSLKRGLKGKDFNCYYANSGAEALKLLESIEIDVIFSDMKMPQMNGLELLKQVDELYPDTVKVILSGYAQLPQLIVTINQANIFKYVAKPWDLHKELIPVITESLEYALYRKQIKQEKATLETKNQAYQKIFKAYNSKADTKGKSWDILRIFHQVYSNVLREQMQDITMVGEKNLAILEYYKNFTDNYLTEIKKSEIYFEPRRIIDEVVYSLKKDGYGVLVDIGVDETSKNLYEGRGLHIKPILISIIEDSVRKETVGTIRIVSTEISREAENVSMVYILEGARSIFPKLDIGGYNIKLYKSLLNIFGGDLEYKENNGNIALFVKVRLHLGQSEEMPDEYTDS